VLDARLQARVRIASRTVTVLFSIHPSLMLPRDTTPRVNLAFYLPTQSGRHHRCPQSSFGLHGPSSPRRQILPRCIPQITLCNHSHSSRRARDRRPSLQIRKSQVHSHYGQAISSTGTTSSRAVRFLGPQTIHVREGSTPLCLIGDLDQVRSWVGLPLSRRRKTEGWRIKRPNESYEV
jgi:hypothetical protein